MAIGPIVNTEPWEDPLREEGRNRYYGEYLGFVRDRNDPQQLGRVRIHVPSILGEEDIEEHWLDWSLPKCAGLFVPPVGSTVIVTFEQGYITHALYSYGWIPGSDAATSAAPLAGKGLLDDTWLTQKSYSSAGAGPPIQTTLPADTARDTRPKYPFNKVYKSEGGHTLELDDTPGFPRARYYHPSGTTLLVDADGSVHVRSSGAQWYEPGGDFIVALKPNATFKVVYPGGTSLACGASGFHVTGHAASLLGRAVLRREKDIN